METLENVVPAETVETIAEEVTATEVKDDNAPLTVTQADIDRRITKAVDNALKRQKATSTVETQEAINKALEAERKRLTMTEEERVAELLADREKAIAERENEYRRKEFTNTVKGLLLEAGLPLSLGPVLSNSCDVDNISETLAEIKRDWETNLSEKVKASARQSEPLTGSVISNEPTSLAELARKNRKV